jgi:hypothetical protein
MLIYILYAVLFTFMLFIYKKEKGIIIPILLLLILNALRGYPVGTDYNHYLEVYPSLNNISSLLNNLNFVTFIENLGKGRSVEIGWALLNYLGGKFSMPFYIVNFFAISIILFFIRGTVRNQSSHFYFSIYLFLMLYLFFPTFNVIRHSIAIAIFAYSIRYINESKPLFYLLFCALALMFHTSAIILPILYLLKYARVNLVTIVALLIFSFIIPALGWDEVLLKMLINDNTLQLYTEYISSKGIIGLSEIGRFMNMFFLLFQTLVFIYCFICLKEHNNIYMILWLLGLLVQNIVMNYQWLFRMNGYFLIAQIIAIPLIVYKSNINESWKKLTYYIIIIYSISLYAYRIYSNAEGIVPYKTIFNL